MLVRTQLVNRGSVRLGTHDESQCSNCGWFTGLDATKAAAPARGTCHRYDFVSTAKTPSVRADDWCFDHWPTRGPGSATQNDLPLQHSNH